jgi:hypothetical protein
MRAISATTSSVSAETMKTVNTRLVAEVDQLASARGVTLAQIALAWLHHRSKVHGLSVVPIPGNRKRPCLSARAVHLTHIAQRFPIQGAVAYISHVTIDISSATNVTASVASFRDTDNRSPVLRSPLGDALSDVEAFVLSDCSSSSDLARADRTTQSGVRVGRPLPLFPTRRKSAIFPPFLRLTSETCRTVGSRGGVDRSTPPSQIRTCSFPASGSSDESLYQAIW